MSGRVRLELGPLLGAFFGGKSKKSGKFLSKCSPAVEKWSVGSIQRSETLWKLKFSPCKAWWKRGKCLCTNLSIFSVCENHPKQWEIVATTVDCWILLSETLNQFRRKFSDKKNHHGKFESGAAFCWNIKKKSKVRNRFTPLAVPRPGMHHPHKVCQDMNV